MNYIKMFAHILKENHLLDKFSEHIDSDGGINIRKFADFLINLNIKEEEFLSESITWNVGFKEKFCLVHYKWNIMLLILTNKKMPSKSMINRLNRKFYSGSDNILFETYIDFFRKL